MVTIIISYVVILCTLILDCSLICIMNFLKKKLKPLTSGLTNAATNVTSINSHPNHNKSDKVDKDLEEDWYDEYVIEAPPHPSELLAIGVDPTDIDVNDPEKLKELYRKAKEEGKDKKTNSVLLAKQRQKEEIEEKKKTREEWKFFDSLTARVEQVVKDSQKNLDHLKESSAVEKLTEPEYELRLSADQLFKSSATVKQEKSANNWIDFEDEDSTKNIKKGEEGKSQKSSGKGAIVDGVAELDEFGCPKKRLSIDDSSKSSEAQSFVVNELLNDFGIDLRPAGQKKESLQRKIQDQAESSQPKDKRDKTPPKIDIDFKAAARPRPRPNATGQENQKTDEIKEEKLDPFDTSFVSPENSNTNLFDTSEDTIENQQKLEQVQSAPKALDPFDTSYVNL